MSGSRAATFPLLIMLAKFLFCTIVLFTHMYFVSNLIKQVKFRDSTFKVYIALLSFTMRYHCRLPSGEPDSVM